LSIIDSQIEMAKGPNQEYEARQVYARDGEQIQDTRELQGQSPFLINAGLNYNNRGAGIETGLFYNVQGKTLEVVGFGLNSDVYTQPFNSLNFNFAKTFGEEKRSKMSLGANNLLGDSRESLYHAFRAETQRFSYRDPGMSFSLGYSYTF